MKSLFAALATLFVFTTIADPAHARRGTTESKQLLFVSNTGFDVQGESLALCQLVSTTSKFFINFWRSVDSYVLATDNCATDSYYKLTPEDLAQGKAQGLIPTDVPDEPKLSMADMASGMWGIGLGAGLLGFLGLHGVNSGRRRKQRHAMMGEATPTATAILDAMCHAAKADGQIDESEIAEIIRIAAEATGETFSPETVRRMIDLAESDAGLDVCTRIIKPVPAEHRALVMQAVLSVVAADGQLAKAEQQFVGHLMAAMKMPVEAVNAMLGEVVGRRATA